MKKLIIIKYGELTTKHDNINYFIKTLKNKEKLQNNMKKLDVKNANKKIVDIVLQCCK